MEQIVEYVLIGGGCITGSGYGSCSVSGIGPQAAVGSHYYDAIVTTPTGNCYCSGWDPSWNNITCGTNSYTCSYTGPGCTAEGTGSCTTAGLGCGAAISNCFSSSPTTPPNSTATVNRTPAQVASTPSFSSVSSHIAYIMDTKFDDGLPSTGRFISTKPWNPTSGAFGSTDGSTIDATLCHNGTSINPSDYTIASYNSWNNSVKKGCVVSLLV